MARRFGSAMISNTDSTRLIYSTEHMRVKVITSKSPGNGFSRRAGMHRAIFGGCDLERCALRPEIWPLCAFGTRNSPRRTALLL
jgi:hypothetical protein